MSRTAEPKWLSRKTGFVLFRSEESTLPTFFYCRSPIVARPGLSQICSHATALWFELHWKFKQLLKLQALGFLPDQLSSISFWHWNSYLTSFHQFLFSIYRTLVSKVLLTCSRYEKSHVLRCTVEKCWGFLDPSGHSYDLTHRTRGFAKKEDPVSWRRTVYYPWKYLKLVLRASGDEKNYNHVRELSD